MRIDQPKGRDPELIALGSAALADVRRRFRQRDLAVYRVIRTARAAGQDHDTARLQAEADNLRRQRDQADAGSLRWLQLDRQFEAQQSLACRAAGYLDGLADKVWGATEGRAAVLRDLEALEAFLRSELDRIVEATIRFSRENGWGAPDRSAVERTTPALHAIGDFLERHVVPGVGAVRGSIEHPDSTTLRGRNVADFCHVLLDCGWRTAPLPDSKNWVTQIANAVLPQAAAVTP